MASAGNHRYAKALVFEESSDYNSGESNTLVCQNGILYFNGKQLSSNTGNQFDIFTANKVTRLSGANIQWASNLVVLPTSDPINDVASAGQGFQSDGTFLYYNGIQISAFSNIYQDDNSLTSNSITPLSNTNFVVNSNLIVKNVMWANAETFRIDSKYLNFSNIDTPTVTFDATNFNFQPVSNGTNVQFLGALNGDGSDCNVNFVSSNTYNVAGTDVVNLKFKNKGDSGTASNNHTIASIKAVQTTAYTGGNDGGGSISLTCRDPTQLGTSLTDTQVTMIHANTHTSANTIVMAPDSIAKVGIMAGYTPGKTFQIGTNGSENLYFDNASNTLALGNFSKILTPSNVWFQGGGDRVTIGSSSAGGERSVVIGAAAGTAANVVSIGFGHSVTPEANIVKIGSYSTTTQENSVSIGHKPKAGVDGVSIGSNAGTLASQYSVSIGKEAGSVLQSGNAVAIGWLAGQSSQESNSVAIGHNAGNSSQKRSAVAIGYSAGASTQSSFSVAIGINSGRIDQGSRSVAIGPGAGESNQESTAVAIGNNAGTESQYANAVSIGSGSGADGQNTAAISIGLEAGYQGQYANSIAIGISSGRFNQRGNAISIGMQAGYNGQNTYGIAMGFFAGASGQNDQGLAFGKYAGESNQGKFCQAIGGEAGRYGQKSYAIAIGYTAGESNQGVESIAIGRTTGASHQGSSGVAIGTGAGFSSQGVAAVAIGYRSGRFSQNTYCVSIGTSAGESYQNIYSVAIGSGAGFSIQGSNSIAIGRIAAIHNQDPDAIAIGYSAGGISQRSRSIAIGTNAGYNSLGEYSTVVGDSAGFINQGNQCTFIGNLAGYNGGGFTNSICINASGGQLNPTASSGCFIKPIRYDTSAEFALTPIAYDSANWELKQKDTISAPGAINFNREGSTAGFWPAKSSGTTINWGTASSISSVNGQTELFNIKGEGVGSGGFGFFTSVSATTTGSSGASEYINTANITAAGDLFIRGSTAQKFSGTTWTEWSDIRLKSNIEDANTQTCYDNMKELKLKRFTMSGEVDDKNHVGFIAQEVENVFPKAVKSQKGTLPDGTEVNDLRSLDADQIYKTMYGTIQHLMKKVEDLEVKVSQLSR